jgi:hypothetical protein
METKTLVHLSHPLKPHSSLPKRNLSLRVVRIRQKKNVTTIKNEAIGLGSVRREKLIEKRKVSKMIMFQKLGMKSKVAKLSCSLEVYFFWIYNMVHRSCASTHLSNEHSWFQDYDFFSPIKLYMGDNSIQGSIKKGNIQVSMLVEEMRVWKLCS